MADSEQLVCISCVSEVRYSFVSHLSEALRRKGISSVIIDVDSDDLLSKESQAKIEISRVSVMVLSRICEPTRVCQNFVNVIECQRNKNQVVVPVLYGESPLLGEWLSVLDLRDFSPVHQSRKECSDSQLVKEIVRDVYEKLFYKGRIGIYSKLLEIEKMVCKQPLGIRCVGIWGMPGIGKTTLAKAVFDQMSGEFDASCFIEDYSKAIQEKGVYCLLEEQFLKENAGGAGGTVTKLSLLRDKLNNKRVLVVLDDVRSPLVVESFLGGFDWFGPKSLIIITSRDKSVFRLCRVNQIYEVQGLNEKEAIQLFSLCASIDDMTEQNLHEVSMKVIKYADGHPLALNIYGRELKGKKGPPEMEIAFLELKERPPNMFVDAIKSCYDTLNDREKNIFLDIAFFFQGENVDYVMQLLEGCGFFPHVGIDVLVEKCLVTISENRMRMHNLIQDVGRHIINRETRQTKRRDRLWEPWSIKYLLEDNGEKENGEHKTTLERAQGPEEIEGMFLDTSNFSFDIKPAAFDNMLNLRLLKIYSSNPEVHHVKNFLKGFLNSLPNELRLLHWENYPLQFLPQNFDPIHLVEINMPYSQLKKLWGGTKNLEMLKTIRLCHSQQLVDIDDVLKAQNLEVIDLQGCTRLQSFPATGQLLHLRIVNLSGCTEIKSFPEIPPNIETLNLQGTGIIELPLSIIKPNYTELLNLLAEIPGLSGVSNLEQSDLKPLTSLMKMSTSNQNLGKLICLELKDCARLRSLPNMNNLELLKVLDLSGCSELETIQGFPQNLKELYLAGTAVRQVPQLPQSLELFNAHGCVSLKSIRVDFEKLPVHYTLSNCFDLCPKVVSDFLVQALANAKRIPREHQQELNKTLAFSFCAPSHANQNSKLDLQPGSSVMTRLNYSWRNTLVGFAILVEVAFSEAYSEATGFGISCVCRWKNKEGHSHRIERNLHCWDLGKAFQKDHMFVFFDVNMRPGTDEGSEPDIWADLVVFEFFPVNNKTKPLDDSCTVTRCGVRVITAVNCNTSIENISPVLSLDPMEVSGNEGEEVLRVSYDGLQEIDKALFLYIACFFNDEDVGLVAPLIANIIDMDVSYGLKVLADRSLIHVSSNGEIVMHYLQRGMGKEILYTESKKTDRLVDNIQTSMIDPKEIEIRFPSGGQHPETSAAAAYFSWPTSSRLNDSAEDRANYFANLQKGVLPETFDGLPTGKKATTLLELMMIRAFHSKNLRRFSLGTAIGFRIRRGVLTNIAAILVFVARKVHKQWLNPLQCLPTALEGPGGVWCDVDVVEFQYYGAPAQTPKEQVYTELVDDLRGSGSSIGSGSQVASQETYGTLGAIVKSKTGIRQVGFLTNRHIAVDLDYPSQKMFHPLPPSLGPGVYLGAVERATSFITDDLWYGIFAGTNPETFVRADGAFIPFAEDFNMNNVTTTVKGIGEIGNIHATDLQSPINSLIGRKVVKVGRSSGLTTGTIMAYALEYNDEKGICFLTDFLVVGENQQTFDLEGDSGSLILLAAGDEKNEKPRPVGIIWGGTANRGRLKLKVGEQPENWTSGVDLGRVLNLLELDLITSNEGLQAAVLEQRNGIMCAGIDSTVESSPGVCNISRCKTGENFEPINLNIQQVLREDNSNIHPEFQIEDVLESAAVIEEHQFIPSSSNNGSPLHQNTNGPENLESKNLSSLKTSSSGDEIGFSLQLGESDTKKRKRTDSPDGSQEHEESRLCS